MSEGLVGAASGNVLGVLVDEHFDSRLAEVRISIDFLAEMLTKGWHVGGKADFVECVEGLPPGAEWVGIGVVEEKEGEPAWAFLTFRHDSFAPVAMGSKIPEITVSFQRIAFAQEEIPDLDPAASEAAEASHARTEAIGEATVSNTGAGREAAGFGGGFGTGHDQDGDGFPDKS